MSVGAKLWIHDAYERLWFAPAHLPRMHAQLMQREIIEVTGHSVAHAKGVRRLQAVLMLMFAKGYDVRVQLRPALVRDVVSAPGPGLAVVPGAIDDYRAHRPSTAALALEVVDTSLEFDRTCKAPVYATAGIQSMVSAATILR